MKKGMVSLVGAGPGDPELITLKGLRRLQEADVVIYDSLIPQGLLAKTRPHAELVFAGKKPHRKARDQASINSLMVEKAREGKRVVRLKGGDPFVFGRGGEEASVLQEAGIAWEVVPGVTSPVAVLAYAGIPLTDRRFSSSFAVITGHTGPSDSTELSSWKELAGHVGTLVCLMATKTLPQIAEDLLSEGLEPDTPSAVVQEGATAGQKTVTGRLEDISRLAKEAHVKHPSILVVGKVASLASELAWYSKLPLFGLRIAVASDPGHTTALAAKLADKGAEVVELPSSNALVAMEKSEGSAVQHIFGRGFHLVCYTSPEAVRRSTASFGQLLDTPAATVGKDTKRTAEEACLRVVAHTNEDLEHLIADISDLVLAKGIENRLQQPKA